LKSLWLLKPPDFKQFIFSKLFVFKEIKYFLIRWTKSITCKGAGL